MVLLIIKILIALGIICLLRFMIWRDSKTNLFHSRIRTEFGSREVNVINYSVFLLTGLAVIIAVFSFPNGLGSLTAGILGLAGALIGM